MPRADRTRRRPRPKTWTRARSPHVEVLTNGSEAQARRAAEHIETFHRVLQSALAPLPGLVEGAPPPLVLAFRDAPSFSRFVPLRNGEPQEVDGVILGGADRTYIAVNLGAEDSDEALAHEYAHFALNPVLPAQPPWLGEGLAELLATASVWPESATLGRASDAHLRRIARDGPMPLRDPARRRVPVPDVPGSRGNARELFYAQSWALVHWIVAGGHGGMPGGDRLRGGHRRRRGPGVGVRPLLRDDGGRGGGVAGRLPRNASPPHPRRPPGRRGSRPAHRAVGRGRGRGGRASRGPADARRPDRGRAIPFRARAPGGRPCRPRGDGRPAPARRTAGRGAAARRGRPGRRPRRRPRAAAPRRAHRARGRAPRRRPRRSGDRPRGGRARAGARRPTPTSPTPPTCSPACGRRRWRTASR